MTIEDAKKRLAFLKDCLMQVSYSDEELDVMESEIETLTELINEAEDEESE